MKTDYIHLVELPFPETIEIERQVLRDASENYETIQDILPIVKEEMFTSPDRRMLWNCIVEMYNAGEQITPDIMVVRNREPYLVEVLTHTDQASVPSVMFGNALLLRNAHLRRKSYQCCLEFMRKATDINRGELDLYADLAAMTAEIQGEEPKTGMVKLSSILKNIKDQFKERANNPNSGRIPTGFNALDHILYGGYEAGNLVILAARPSVGKTAVMLQMAAAAGKAGKYACVFSMEMLNEDLGNRLIFSTGLVNAREFYQGVPECEPYLDNANRNLEQLPVYINDQANTLADVISQITIQNKRGKCDIVFIDYLGRFQEAIDNKIPLYQAIGKITGRLKSLAKRLRIPVVLLCQLNRESAKEKDKEGTPRPPELFDLRDSGSIEQDADIVLMLEPRSEIRQVFAGTETKIEESPLLIMWLKKHRQGWKNDGIELRPNSTYSQFIETGKIIH